MLQANERLQRGLGAEASIKSTLLSLHKHFLSRHLATPIKSTTPRLDRLLDEHLIGAEILSNGSEIARVTLLVGRGEDVALEVGQALDDGPTSLARGDEGPDDFGARRARGGGLVGVSGGGGGDLLLGRGGTVK